MNPENGRFLTTDPFSGFMHEPLTLHKYLYAGLNPVTNIDPNGHMLIAMNFNIGFRFMFFSSIAIRTYYAIIQTVRLIGPAIALLSILTHFESSIYLNTKHDKDVIEGLLVHADIHAEKIGSSPPEDPNKNHWKKEVRAALQRAKRIAEKRLKGKTRDAVISRINDIASRSGISL
jgi:hypothetical protein